MGNDSASRCVACRDPVSADEIGLTKKLINRGTKEFYCFRCLSEHFRISEENLREMIIRFRKQGCTLFSPWVEDDNQNHTEVKS